MFTGYHLDAKGHTKFTNRLYLAHMERLKNILKILKCQKKNVDFWFLLKTHKLRQPWTHVPLGGAAMAPFR